MCIIIIALLVFSSIHFYSKINFNIYCWRWSCNSCVCFYSFAELNYKGYFTSDLQWPLSWPTSTPLGRAAGGPQKTLKFARSSVIQRSMVLCILCSMAWVWPYWYQKLLISVVNLCFSVNSAPDLIFWRWIIKILIFFILVLSKHKPVQKYFVKKKFGKGRFYC